VTDCYCAIMPGLWASLRSLLDRRLVGIAACVCLFQFANAPTLPLVASELTRTTGVSASLVVAAHIVGPRRCLVPG